MRSISVRLRGGGEGVYSRSELRHFIPKRLNLADHLVNAVLGPLLHVAADPLAFLRVEAIASDNAAASVTDAHDRTSGPGVGGAALISTMRWGPYFGH